MSDAKAIYHGGPAFPAGTGTTLHSSGMTMRDYFAAKAMQGMIEAFGYKSSENNFVVPDAIPKFAYQLADEMLKARNE